MFCSQFGDLVPKDDEAFDLDEFLDMCSSESMSNWSAVKRIEGMEEGDESELGEKQQRLNALDVRGDFPVDPFQAPPRVKTSAVEASPGDDERLHRLRVMEWAQTHLDGAGYGRGRVVTVAFYPLENTTVVRLVDAQNPLEMSIPKAVGDVTEDDVKTAIAAWTTVGELLK